MRKLIWFACITLLLAAGVAFSQSSYMPGDPIHPTVNNIRALTVTSLTIRNGFVQLKGAVIAPMYLAGLVLSNDGTSPNTVFDVSTGSAADDTNAILMHKGNINKTLGSWAVGSGQGCLDTGSVAQSTWYYIYLIDQPQGTQQDIVDILCSTSTTPTFPPFFVYKRLIGWIFTCDTTVCAAASTNIAQFTQDSGDVLWSTHSALDINIATLSTSAALQTLTHVPPGMKVIPICDYTISNAAPAASVLLTSPDSPDEAPTTTQPFTAVPGFSQDEVSSAGFINSTCPYMRTNTSQQIRARATAASTTLAIVVRGWRT